MEIIVIENFQPLYISLLSTHYFLSDFGTAGAKGVRKSDDYMKNYFVDRYGAIKSVDLAPIIQKLIDNKNEE